MEASGSVHWNPLTTHLTQFSKNFQRQQPNTKEKPLRRRLCRRSTSQKMKFDSSASNVFQISVNRLHEHIFKCFTLWKMRSTRAQIAPTTHAIESSSAVFLRPKCCCRKWTVGGIRMETNVLLITKQHAVADCTEATKLKKQQFIFGLHFRDEEHFRDYSKRHWWHIMSWGERSECKPAHMCIPFDTTRFLLKSLQREKKHSTCLPYLSVWCEWGKWDAFAWKMLSEIWIEPNARLCMCVCLWERVQRSSERANERRF